MRLERALTIRFAFLSLAVILIVAYVASRPSGHIITDASFGSETISPNADHRNDATTIRYRLRRESTLSIYLEDEASQRYYFRRDESRAPGEYEVQFSGIVEPYQRDGEDVKGTIIQRLVPNGTYTWVIEAADRTGAIDRATGTLEVIDADTELPDIWEFSIGPDVFTPNQDGLFDRVEINVYVPKEAELFVYLIDEAGQRIFVPEFEGGRDEGEPGRHSFEYDGGIENGSDPPPNGDYQVLVEAHDAAGQQVQAVGSLNIDHGGVPLAEIMAQPVGDTVRFSAETVQVGDILAFELTVWNYGDAPIRTTGPEPGYVYDQDEVFGNTGFFEESGAWRVGINCDTCLTPYPWRWSLGTRDELTPIETNGVTHYYLMPGEQVVVTGGIRLYNIVESRNPQRFWAGLIHEDVEIAPLNNFVDPHYIEIVSLDNEADE